MSFIDEKCIVFDNEEENKLCYSALHQEFKELVERVLTEHLMDVGVAPEDFFEACEVAYQREASDFAKQVIEQILACDDFLTFKTLMFERNKELEYEAIQALNASGRHIGANSDEISVDDESKHESKEDSYGEEKDDLELALELSKQADAASKLVALEKEQAEIEKAIALSLLLAEEKEKQEHEGSEAESKAMEPLDSKSHHGLDDESKAEEKQESRVTFKKMTHVQRTRSSRAILGGNPLPPINSNVKLSKQRSAVERFIDKGVASSAAQPRQSAASSGEIDKVELARRTRHLQAQREKLLAKKKAERMSRLQIFEQEKPKQTGQQSIRQGSRSEVESKASDEAKPSTLTRALAQKMKRELLNEDPFYSYGFIHNDTNEADDYAALDARLRRLDNVRAQQQELLQHEV